MRFVPGRNQICAMLTVVVASALLSGCTREEKLDPIPQPEPAKVVPRADNFNIYPGATSREEHTELLKKATRALNPQMKELPSMATFETDAPVEEVAAFYASRYGIATVAASDAPDASGHKPPAYYSTGEMTEAAAVVKAALEKLGMPSDVTATGSYRSVHIDATPDLPRVSIQRPYLDPISRTVVDKTLIQLVRE